MVLRFTFHQNIFLKKLRIYTYFDLFYRKFIINFVNIHGKMFYIFVHNS